MTKSRLALAALAALLALAACSRQPAAGGLSQQDESDLDNAAGLNDNGNFFDASPDSLVANEAEIAAEESRSAGNRQ
jgi:hypothetical protein